MSTDNNQNGVNQNGVAMSTDATSTALVPASQASTSIVRIAPQSIDETWRLAEIMAKSNLLPPALRGRPSDVFMQLLTGSELGLLPGQSIRGIDIIEGKPSLKADLIIALVLKDPTPCEYFTLVESTRERATYETKRRGNPKPTSLTFTMEQAKAAGLHDKKNWKHYPDAMLRARCAAALARAVYPDKVFGLYDPDEIETVPVGKAKPIQAKPEPAAPANDITGYTAPPEPQDAEYETAPSAEQLSAAIAAAEKVVELEALVPQLKAFAGPEKDTLREAYVTRRSQVEE